MEERLAALEKAVKEQAQIGLELRRDLYGRFGTISDHMGTVKTQFAVVEVVLEEKVTEIGGQMEAMRRHLEAAEARLPLDGALVKQGFAKLEGELEILKKNAANGEAERLTKPMIVELELMR